jgi:hypothetical protein
VTEGFALRAPWYVRARRGIDLRDARSLRPVIQMYDRTDFVDRLLEDPGHSLAFTLDDRFSYPRARTPSGTGIGRFVTHELVHTRMRKLYQPSHNRFYVVVVEVFCDAPGLPRAGSHQDLTVSMVVRRRQTSLQGTAAQHRRLARALLTELGKNGAALGPADLDVGDVLFAEEAERQRFEQDHAPLIEALGGEVREQGWLSAPGAGWTATPSGEPGHLPMAGEEELPMFRLPPRPDCPPDATRSLWFGLVPTYSSDHWTEADGNVQAKLDDRSIYAIRCVVTQPPAPGHEHCPPKRYASVPTRPFKLAAAYDPDGTKNRTISVTAPDLRRLAATAGRPRGSGGMQITTPPGSRLGPVDFKAIPGANLGAAGGGSICTFAIELFFIVALFLFLLFLPIVVLAFQLWWMLALRFCLPPSLSFSALTTFFATHDLDDLDILGTDTPVEIAEKLDLRAKLDEVLGIDDALTHLRASGSDFDTDPGLIGDLVAGITPPDEPPGLPDPEYLTTPPDPLCPADP